jgi:hypothetical protein
MNKEKLILDQLKHFLCSELCKQPVYYGIDKDTLEMVIQKISFIEMDYQRHENVKNMKFISNIAESQAMYRELFSEENFRPREPARILCSALYYHINDRIKRLDEISDITEYENVKLENIGAVRELTALLSLVQKEWD